jgi:hypothetical protein
MRSNVGAALAAGFADKPVLDVGKSLMLSGHWQRTWPSSVSIGSPQ